MFSQNQVHVLNEDNIIARKCLGLFLVYAFIRHINIFLIWRRMELSFSYLKVKYYHVYVNLL